MRGGCLIYILTLKSRSSGVEKVISVSCCQIIAWLKGIGDKWRGWILYLKIVFCSVVSLYFFFKRV